MKPVVSGFLIEALLFGGLLATGRSQDQQHLTPTPVVLTNDRPTGSFPIGQETLASAPPILALTITKVVDPGQEAMGFFVYLSFRSSASSSGANNQPASQKILIGNFSLYPADRPGGFLLRASTAFNKLKAASSKPTDVRLVLEMKRLHETKPWPSVAVTVAPPEWRDEGSPK
jgi:hypothetical protein